MIGRATLAVAAIVLAMATTPLTVMAVSYDDEPVATASPAASASAAPSITLVPFEDPLSGLPLRGRPALAPEPCIR